MTRILNPNRPKLSNKPRGGTSYHMMNIVTTVDKLIDAIGAPQIESNDGNDKVNVEWICELSDGTVFTIYDWKEYRPIEFNEEIEFHIGAKDKASSQRAMEALGKLGIGETKITAF
jgi:hypothetical protein